MQSVKRLWPCRRSIAVSNQPNQPNRKPGTQVAPRQPSPPAARIQPNALLMAQEHWNRLERLASRAFQSGVLPHTVKSEAAAFTIALKGIALGLDPLYAMEHISIINGKATIDGQAMLALIYGNGSVEVIFPPAKEPANECSVTMKRKGAELTVTWTIERAKKAGLLTNPAWQKYPDQMLRWRAISECARVIAPDVIGGLYLHEEMAPKANVTPSGEIIEAEFTVNQAPSGMAQTPANSTKAPEGKADMEGPGKEASVVETSLPSNAQMTTSAQAPSDVPSKEGEAPSGDSRSSENPPNASPSSKLSDDQMARLFVLEKKAEISHELVKTMIMKKWGLRSSKELNYPQYDELTKYLEDVIAGKAKRPKPAITEESAEAERLAEEFQG
jgi:hypothetical protein